MENKLKFHPISVPRVTTDNRDLGRQIAQMRYDQLGEVIEGMSTELERQAEADLARGRPQLSTLLQSAKITLNDLNALVQKMFKISRPYMEHEFAPKLAELTAKKIVELEERGADTHTCTSAVIIRDGKILLGLRHYTPDKWKTISVWTTPGGRCDTGESVEEGLRRETKEETGISDIVVKEFLGCFPGVADSQDTLWAFLCGSDSEPELMEPDKFSEWKWFALTEIPENFINPPLLQLILGSKSIS